MDVYTCVFSRVQLFVTPQAVAHQFLLSMEFSRQEYWSGLPFPTQGDLPNPRIKPSFFVSPALPGGFFTITPPGGEWIHVYVWLSSFAMHLKLSQYY